MNGGSADAEPVFPGSRGAAHLVEWIDRVLLHLREGRMHDARAALEGEEWRALGLDGIPQPIRNQLDETLDAAARALREPDPSTGEAEEALLIARSRFMPGA